MTAAERGLIGVWGLEDVWRLDGQAGDLGGLGGDD